MCWGRPVGGLVACRDPQSQGGELTPSPAAAEIAPERPSPPAPSARPAAPRTCHGPHAGLSGGLAARTGGGDWAGGARRVTSRAPVPAAEIGQPPRRCYSSGQRRLRELEPRQPSSAPRTRRQPERPTEGRGAGSPLPPRGAPSRPPSPATWSSFRPRPPQVRGAASERSWGRCQVATAASRCPCTPLGSVRPRPRVCLQGPAGCLLVLTAAPGELSLPACGEAGTGPPHPG